MTTKFIDIHTHSSQQEEDVYSIKNIFLQDTIGSNELNESFSVGLHPWHLNEMSIANAQKKLELFSDSLNCVAIGEIGLDRAIHVTIEKQLEVFEMQVEIAEEKNKPIIIHCVRAFSDILSVLKKASKPDSWIFHGFNGNQIIADKLIKSGCYLSFGADLFNKDSKVTKVFKETPLDNIFLETDESNVSIKEIYSIAAEYKQMPITDLKKKLIGNFERCFGV